MNPYLEAARPKTLFNAIAPVIMGTSAGVLGLLHVNTQPQTGSIDMSDGFAVFAFDRVGALFCLGLLTSIAATIAVNYANDLFDGIAGNDGEERTGPRRAVAAGLVTPKQMAIAFGLALTVFIGSGLTFVWVSKAWALVAVGLLSVVLLYCYSGGPYPLASHGLGEVAVFITYGLTATVGTAYAICGDVKTALPYGVAMGCFSCAVLEANNIRDIPEDTQTNKRTVAVRLGDADARNLYTILILIPYGISLWAAGQNLYALGAFSTTWMGLAPLVSFLSLPLAIRAIKTVRSGVMGQDLIPVIPLTGKAMTLWAITMSLGLLVVFAAVIIGVN